MTLDLYILFKLYKLKKQFDSIYVPYTSNSHLAYPMVLAKKLINVPYIISIHGGGMHSWKLKTPHSMFFKNAGAIVAVSNTIKDDYEKRSKRKITVIPPLIPFKRSTIPRDDIRTKYGFGIQDTIILTLGSLKRIKGSNLLMDAFLSLGKEYIEKHNLKLVYVGEGPMRPDLQEKCDRSGFSQYIKFLGAVPYGNVPEIYSLADIYAIPSLYEGMPITLLEAMFNGLPIIGSNTIGINSLIRHGENGLLFERENTKDLEAAIRQIVEDKVLSGTMGKNAYNFYLEQYNFENMVNDYIEIMKNICGDQNE